MTYLSFPAKPAGTVDLLITPGAGPSRVVSNTLQESNSTAVNGGYNCAAILPDLMAIATSVSVTITVGSLSVAANNRSVGPGVFAADGSKGIYLRFASQSSTAVLIAWNGTSETQLKSSTQVASPGDTVTLTGTLSAGIWTWTVKKNGGADIAAFTWSDTAHTIDLPGMKPGIAFRHQYASAQASSRGVSALSATAA